MVSDYGVSPLDYALWLSQSNPDFGYGKRELTGENKGIGYLGPLGNRGDTSTEISAFDDLARGEYPLMVPTLSRDQLKGLLSGQVDQETYDVAARYAELRKLLGLSPFASPLDYILGNGLLK